MATRFDARKHSILAQLQTPDSEYHDLSPKGSVDEPIRDLIGEINSFDGIVTTSSCSGRISVFLEGRKATNDDALTEENHESRAGPGGKGGGGTWLFISHTPIETWGVDVPPSFTTKFGLVNAVAHDEKMPEVNSRYIHLKFEPMILHILTASTNHAQRILTAGLGAGFRESGAVSLSTTKGGDSTPLVAVRSTGYSFDSIIGYQDQDGQNIPLVDERYLQTLILIVNDRFRINKERIDRFRTAIINAFQPQNVSPYASASPEWEEADARKRRKREEGLARQQALQTVKFELKDNTINGSMDVGSVDSIFS
ncbi:methyltransferase TYW3-domain-containing protein [Phaeosphaeriaceae sp. PMI808]|nr:methyltransferase TYW3-domain-containing protein [Phaeosphaeriaceae sp. PMI808]